MIGKRAGLEYFSFHEIGKWDNHIIFRRSIRQFSTFVTTCLIGEGHLNVKVISGFIPKFYGAPLTEMLYSSMPKLP